MLIDRDLMASDLAAHLAGAAGADLLPYGERSLLKTNIVEAHSAFTLDDARERLEAAADADGSTLRTTNDPSLFLLTTQIATDAGSEDVGFWVDTADPRFWLMHSKTKATPTRTALRRLVARNPRLDVAWLPRGQMRNVQHQFEPLGFRLGFDERAFYKRQDVTQLSEPTHKLSVEHAGVGAESVYELLEQSDVTRRALAMAEVTFWEAADGGNQIMKLTRDGRLQSQGQSLDSHLGAAHRLVTSYSSFVHGLERAFALRFTENGDGDVAIEGRPLGLRAAKPEGFAFSQLVQRLVSGVEPFRLLGTVDWRAEDLAWVEAVDLHTGSAVRMDLTPEWVRMYLGAGHCGNTLARFVTNLQRSYNADIQFLDEPGRELLGAAS